MARSRSRSRSRERGRRRYSSSDDSDRDRRKKDRHKKRRRSTSRHDSRSRSDKHHSDRNRSRRRERSRSRSRSPTRPSSSRRQEKSDRRDSERNGKKETSSISLKEKVARLTSAAAATSLESSRTVAVDEKPSAEAVAQIEAQGFEQHSFVSSATNNQNSNHSGRNKSQTKVQTKDSHESAIFGNHNNDSIAATTLLKSNGMYKNCGEDDLLGPIFCVDQKIRTQRWLEKLKIIRDRISRESK